MNLLRQLRTVARETLTLLAFDPLGVLAVVFMFDNEAAQKRLGEIIERRRSELELRALGATQTDLNDLRSL